MLQSAGYDVIHHPINMGYIDALRTGISVALEEGHEFVLFCDSDGQHRIEDVLRLIEHHRAHPENDIIVGSRYLGNQRAATWLRHVVAQGFALCVRLLTRQRVSDVTSGLKLLNRRAMSRVINSPLEDGHAEFLVYVCKRGCRVAEIPIFVEPRKAGASMYHLAKQLRYLPKTFFLMVLATISRRPTVGSR